MANKKKFYGKRMVPEYLITKLEELEPGGGGTDYQAGNGITIANDTISANIKAGSGIVVDEDLTDNSLVVMIDQEDIPYKSDLSTVATTGSYNDLTNKPTIPAAQVQSDWSQSDNTQVDFIKNKPTIPDTTNLVTTNTTQTISGDKTFTGSNVKINALATADDHITMSYDTYGGVPSIQFYDSNFDPSAAIFTDANDILTFNGLDGVSIKNGPDKTFNIPSKSNGTYTLATTDDIPTSTSDLTNDSGFITSSALSGYATETYVDNEIGALSIPTTATSNSSVTPSTVQLTFTYSDNTTETITLMTGASVTTTTTLS